MDSYFPADPVVLTWPAEDTSTPSHDPPAYDEARLPLNPVNYEFSPQGFNALLLLPPSNLPDTRPLYYISVAMNCMNPFSFITTVHKGASNSGPYVGEFEMGISTIPGTVAIGDCQKRIRDVVHHVHTRWTWTFRADRSQHIRWELPNSSTGIFNCFLASDPYPASPHLKIAQFKGASFNQKGTERTPPSMLRVYPTGQPLFDDILLSVLIIERRRLQPPAPQTYQTESIWWS
ncbi:hypothetical protein MSAN_01284400 [Mycena sanguinolenta]|uniref:DUF6593 domain-containing protein n=1 Tax=Mycena sanguinolenta TaxID=230812 RepID=A0A8H6YE27_9AGAR|nr:hypothetical protein MSAN_01284400 [Mycena sanguinolenta]